MRVREREEKNTSEKQLSTQVDKYGPSMPTKTIRVFSGTQISGGEYSETNMDKYCPSMPTKTIIVFNGS